jgi:hypothetical protein
MDKTCKNNEKVIDIFSILFQVVFIFTFLTIFFFVYVVKVEKDDFQNQINLLVDDILDEDVVKDNLNKIILPYDSPFNENFEILLYGVLDIVKEKSIIENRKPIQDVLNKNNKTKKKAIKYLSITLLVLIALTFIMIIIGYCLPIKYQIIEALWVVFFVALTELTFLTFIAKKYISADPNKVKRILCSSITKWIETNKKSTNLEKNKL